MSEQQKYPEKLESHIVIVTTFYPNNIFPQRAIFVKLLTEALARFCSVTVVAPVPYRPGFLRRTQWGKLARVPGIEENNGIKVFHPRFIAIPKLEMFSGLSYLIGTFQCLKRLRSQHKKMILNGHRIYPDGAGVALLAWLYRIPYVLTAHGSDINRTFTRLGMKHQMKAAMRNANVLIAVSNALREIINANIDRDIKHIPCSGYNPEVFRPQQISARPGRTILYIGELLKLKGTDLLIEAWNKLLTDGDVTKNDQLILIGEGNYRAHLENKINEYELEDTVMLAGNVEHHDIPGWLNQADVFCLPSFMEGTPNVIVEALSCGVPVCATRVGGIPELIDDGVNGILIKELDVNAVSQALLKTLETVWDNNTLTESVRNYTWDNIARSYYSVFKDIENNSRNEK